MAKEKPEDVRIPFDPINEQIVLAAAATDPEARAKLVKTFRPDHFLVEAHRPLWAAMQELERRRLDYEPAVLQRLGSGDVNYLEKLVQARPEAPAGANLDHHVATMHWDHLRATVAQGPMTALLDAFRRPQEAPERVRALARQVADSLNVTAAGRFLRDAQTLVDEAMRGIRQRRLGHACWPYGVDGLDVHENGARDEKGRDISGRMRTLPGAAPGQVTVLTSVSGGGKTTMAARIALGQVAQGRKVLYGAWEMGGPMTLEVLACMSLGWSRTDLTEGRFGEEEERELERRMDELCQWVRFMDNPFQRNRGGRESNERNMDLVQQHIEDSAVDVFVADLWERCLVGDEPSEEKRALYRQQAMAEETRTHHILLAQQRIKDIEQRSDKRPTREGIKGSSAYVDIADTILAPHRPALWKRMDDDRLEVIFWKQRHGKWPLVVEFDWDAEFGSITNGRGIPFEPIGNGGGELQDFAAPAESHARARARQNSRSKRGRPG